jgi:mitochondrial fission protein ELM1
MKPSLIPISRFDLAVIPSHDNPPDLPNVVKTLAAPNRVSHEHLLAEADLWKAELPFSRDPIVSWIIGGPSSSAPFNSEHVLDGLIATLEWAQENHWQVWLSTARRTPESLEKKISELAQNHPALTWKLLWHRDQRNPLYAMFAVSNVAVVTSDSVSMIAEAASAGRGPVVYQASPQTQKRKTKHDRMVTSLLSGGFCARAAIPIDLIRELRAVDSGSRTFPILNDTDRAADRLLELLRP